MSHDLAHTEKKAKMKLSGMLNISKNEKVFFPLRNYFDKAVRIQKITLEQEPEDDVMIVDLKVGKNSQTANSGSFRASILNRLPAVNFDAIPSGMDFFLIFSSYGSDYSSRVTLDLAPHEGRLKRNSLLHVGRTQVAGTMREMAVSRKLFGSFESGATSLAVQVRPDIPDHQDPPSPRCFKAAIKKGKVCLESPAKFTIEERFKVEFEGANKFDDTDVVGILEDTE